MLTSLRTSLIIKRLIFRRRNWKWKIIPKTGPYLCKCLLRWVREMEFRRCLKTQIYEIGGNLKIQSCLFTQETRLEQGQDPLKHNQSLTLEKGTSTNSLDSMILNPPNIVQAVDTYLDIQKLGRRVGRWVVGVLTSQDALMIGRWERWSPHFLRRLNDWEMREVDFLFRKLQPLVVRRSVENTLS